MYIGTPHKHKHHAFVDTYLFPHWLFYFPREEIRFDESRCIQAYSLQLYPRRLGEGNTKQSTNKVGAAG